MITRQEVLEVQKNWGNAIVKIGKSKTVRTDCESATEFILAELYAFDEGKVLFKPTKASELQFRPLKELAKSYFIGGNVRFPEDHGFALHPWVNVRFENHDMILEENRAIAMGNYYFTDLNGVETKVEYTFGYLRNSRGKLKIDVHHSSLPYEPEK
jgi:hypothetical protein